MGLRRSSEIAAVMQRVVAAWEARDMATLSNLFAHGDTFVGVGTDADEWWLGGDRFLEVRETQFREMPPFTIEAERIDAFELGPVGWAAARTIIRTPTLESVARLTAVFELDAGVWRVVHWHGSIGTPNIQTFGVELTTTLDDLLAAVGGDPNLVASLGADRGTMTLAFTDIVDSTAHAEAIGDDAWLELLARHDECIRRVTAAHDGRVVKMLGDGSMLAFESARSGVQAGIGIQQTLVDEPFAVRIGIHTGDVVKAEGDVLGQTVNKAARVAAAAGGGQVMVSATVRDVIGALPGVRFGPSALVELKGLSGTHELVPVLWS
jgi:adenylate cyclase